MKSFNRNAGLGVVVREFQFAKDSCDYLLFVDGKAAGVIEARKRDLLQADFLSNLLSI